MAFRILSEKEIGMLSEKERQIYETEYKEYSERKAFVERLEYLEGVKFPKVRPKKKPIKVIKAPEVSWRKTEPYTVKQPDSLKNGRRFQATADSKRALPKVGDVKISPLPAVSVPERMSKGSVAEYEFKPFTAFDFSQVSKPEKNGVKVNDAGFTIGSLPVINSVSVSVSADIPDYDLKQPEKVKVCSTDGVKQVIIPEETVKLPDIKAVKADVPDVKADVNYRAEVPGVTVAKSSVSNVNADVNYKAEVPGVAVVKSSVSNVNADINYKAEVPGVAVAKTSISNVNADVNYKAEVPGATVAKSSVSNVNADVNYKAEVSGVTVAKTSISNVNADVNYKAEVPGVTVAKSSVSNVNADVNYKAEVHGVTVAKPSISDVNADVNYKVEVHGVTVAKSSVSNVNADVNYKAEVPAIAAAKLPDISVDMGSSVNKTPDLPKVKIPAAEDLTFNASDAAPQKKQVPVYLEPPVMNCEIKEFKPHIASGVVVKPAVTAKTINTGEVHLEPSQMFVAKPADMNVKINEPVIKAAEVKPFIAKADVSDASETIEKILGLLR
jgi:hypothetical protein